MIDAERLKIASALTQVALNLSVLIGPIGSIFFAGLIITQSFFDVIHSVELLVLKY